jgi:tetratricopeptide (TPR) repeat protein
MNPRIEIDYNDIVEEGNRYFQRGDYACAMTFFLDAFRICPESPVVLFNVGRAMEELGDMKAEDFYLAAINKGSTDAQYQLGVYYASIGRKEDAVDTLKGFLRAGLPPDEWSKHARVVLKRLGAGELELVWKNPKIIS